MMVFEFLGYRDSGTFPQFLDFSSYFQFYLNILHFSWAFTFGFTGFILDSSVELLR